MIQHRVPNSTSRWAIAIAGAALLAFGCGKNTGQQKQDAGAASTAGATDTAASSKTDATASKTDARERKFWPARKGPVLAVVAGKGVGPIMLGANTNTIERLMGESCNEKTDSRCRFYYRAVEFDLKEGVASRIHVHRRGRRAATGPGGEPILFGAFNGAIPPDVEFGMFRHAVEQSVGKPLSERPASDAEKAADFGTVEVTEYDGMTLEYDKLENGNVVLGGIIVKAADAAKPGTGG